MIVESMSRVEAYRYQDYAGVFSRSVFTDVLKYGDCSAFDRQIRVGDVLGRQWDSDKRPFVTYLDFLMYIYKEISKNYRCEYVYKNEIIKKAIATHFRKKDTVAFNEFRVGDSIVDMALFNGESRAFEIKTEYDSTKRLDKQLRDYSRIFQKCYVVVPVEQKDFYEDYLDGNTGIVLLSRTCGRIKLELYRDAIRNNEVDPHILMSTLRTGEYKNIVRNYYGQLPDVSCFEMYKACEALLGNIPSDLLAAGFINEVKGRKGIINELKQYPESIRQMCLSMNLRQKEADRIISVLSNPITI